VEGAPGEPAIDDLDRGKLYDAMAQGDFQAGGLGVEDYLAHAGAAFTTGAQTRSPDEAQRNPGNSPGFPRITA
jgi:hypothetical protein